MSDDEETWKSIADPDCDKCGGLGYRVVCAFCEYHEPHSYCDDTWRDQCECVKRAEALKNKKT